MHGCNATQGGTTSCANGTGVTWIYDIPIWLFATVVIAVMCGCSGGGLYLVRRFGPPADQITHNDVAGPIIGTAGTILAVALSFMVVTVWQEFDASAANVQTGASALADLYHLSGGFPPSFQKSLRADIRRYARDVVDIEWPLMRMGKRSASTRNAAYAIARDIFLFKPATQTEQVLQTQALSLTQTFIDTRRRRLFDNDQGIPVALWAMMFFISAVTIALTFLFRVDRLRPHVLMTIALAGIIGATFVLIAELDYPFRGSVSVSSSAYQHVLNVVDGHDTGNYD